MKLFLIAGKAGSGKNEVANIIKEYMDNTVVTSLSKYIKLFALELTDWKGLEENKPRAFLQNMGDLLRSIDIDFLTKRIVEDIEVYKKVGIENIVISDVRLLDEILYFKKLKDVDIITIRVNSNKSKRKLDINEQQHHTELDLDNYEGFDYQLVNDFSDKLKNDVIKILEGMI